MLNSAPVTFAPEIVTLPVPVFVRTPAVESLLLRMTCPKLKLVGLPEIRSVTPVPDSGTLVGELVAVLEIETLPVALPAAAGANVEVKVALWPAIRIRGSDGPLTPKPCPATVACVSVTGAMPVLETRKVWLPAAPTVTVPKLKLSGEALHDAMPCADTSATHAKNRTDRIIVREIWGFAIRVQIWSRTARSGTAKRASLVVEQSVRRLTSSRQGPRRA